MTLFYDIAFLIFALISLPHSIKRRLRNIDYKGMAQRRWFSSKPIWHKDDQYPKIWLNGVSVGEIISLAPLIEQFELEYPGIRLVISASTGTGYQRIKKCYPSHQAVGMPFDFSFCVRRRLKSFNPDLIITVESDLWPNFLSSCADFEIPFIVVGGRLSKNSAKNYKKAHFLLEKPFSAVTLFLAQDAIDAQRAIDMGIPSERVHVGGNLKFDLLDTKVERTPHQLNSLRVDEKQICLLASSHEPEEMIFAKAIQDINGFMDNWLWIVVPRHPERSKRLQKDLLKIKIKSDFYTDFLNLGQLNSNVMIVDQIGVLKSFYTIADIAFIGGSLIPHGGQNMIEPAALGCPVLFGPHVENFREVSELLLKEKAAHQVSNVDELTRDLSKFITSSSKRKQMAQIAKCSIESRRGVAQKCMKILKCYID